MKKYRWKKGEQISGDDFRDVESEIRSMTEARDDFGNSIAGSYLDDIDSQYAKKNIEVIIKTWRERERTNSW